MLIFWLETNLEHTGFFLPVMQVFMLEGNMRHAIFILIFDVDFLDISKYSACQICFYPCNAFVFVIKTN